MQIEKGKLHGSIDVGLSVMAIKKKAKCIDLDAEENIYHLKVKHNANEKHPQQTYKKWTWIGGMETWITQIIPFPDVDIKMTLKWPHVLYMWVRENYSTCVCFSTFTPPPLPLCWFLIVVSALQNKSQELFDEWVSKLRHHRLYRQNEIAMYSNEKSFHYPHYPSPNSPSMAESASIRKVYLYSAQQTQENYVVCVK